MAYLQAKKTMNYPNRIREWTARSKELDALIKPMVIERATLDQKILVKRSWLKVGDMIEWREWTHRGRVIEIMPWIAGAPVWRVIEIQGDGSDGAICEVRNYMDVKLV